MRLRFPALALAAGAFSCPASADLLCHPSVKAPDVYQALYDRAPERARRLSVTLRIKPPGMRGRGAWWLDYPGHGPLIGLDRQHAPRAFAHELGHHLHATQFSREEWDRWRAFVRGHRGKLPEPPAGSSDPVAAGYFAETFAHWLLGKRLHPVVKAEIESYF